MGIKKYSFFVSITLFAFIAVTLCFCSSENGEGGLYCYNCKTTMPDSAELIIQVTINSENPKVPIEIYEGNYKIDKTGKLLYRDTIAKGELNFLAPTNKTYSAVAYYKNGNRIILAIDGGVFNRQEQTGCETTCWQLIGGKYDVRLKDY